ncbi:thioredoxin [Roseovarius indicus]|nr:thioredoxin [Roseovarius indicus]
MSWPFGGNMKILSALVLYTCMIFGANAALADMNQLAALREGDMKKLSFHSEPKPVSQSTYTMEDGSTGSLADYRGKIAVVNFWATWCAPCRKEMPMLSELQSELGGEDFDVVTIATGRNPPPAMKSFFDEIGVSNLPLHRDPNMKISREMGILGLPITVILNRDGQEIARMQGDAHWNSDSAKTIIKALIDNGASG